MSEYFSNKIDFIIMIILALLVAFIIGFNILQLIDSKLSSVTINVPTTNCSIPPIYLNIDKNSNIKQIKLNDVISKVSNESNTNIEGFDSLNNYYNYEHEYEQEQEQENKQETENFGNLQDYPLIYDDARRHLISSIITEPIANKVIEQKNIYETAQDQNYNSLNNIPLLISPDTNVPNRAGPESKGYYSSRVKLIEDTNSPLMKLAKSNKDKINDVIAKGTLADSNKVPEVNGTFDGYNSFVDLRTDSYANITSIGKSMLSPYVSYPVPS